MKITYKFQSDTIRQTFRKQIRRKQIDQLLLHKRKILQTPLDQQNQILHQYHLQPLYNSLKISNTYNQSLTLLVQFTSIKTCLYNTQLHYGKQKTQKLCLLLTHFILNTLLPNLTPINQQNKLNRKKCLVILSNIIADQLSPHSQLIPIINQGLSINFPQIIQANIQQSIQIGWIISNIFCHTLDLSIQSNLQKSIQQLLTLTQDIILTPNLQIIGLLYISLNKFFLYLDHFFYHPSNSTNQQIQHYKVHRLILLENTVNYNLTILMGSKLKNIIPFIENNLIYAPSCDEKLTQQICKKCFKILQCGGSDAIMNVTLKLVSKLTGDRDIVVTIIKDYFQTLHNILLFQGPSLKIETMKLLGSLFIDQQIGEFIASQKHLQYIISELVKNVRDQSTLISLISLTKIIIDKTKYKYGKLAIESIEQNLLHRAGDLGKNALEIIQQYQDQTNQMN